MLMPWTEELITLIVKTRISEVTVACLHYMSQQLCFYDNKLSQWQLRYIMSLSCLVGGAHWYSSVSFHALQRRILF